MLRRHRHRRARATKFHGPTRPLRRFHAPADPMSRGDGPGQRQPTPEIKMVAYAAAEGPAQAPAVTGGGDVSAKRTAEKPQTLEIPSAIPGSEAPPLRLPPLGPDTTAAQRQSEIEKLYGELNVVTPAVGPPPTPGKDR